MNNKKILLIELAGIGDTILSTPAIRNLRENYPNSFIYFLTFRQSASLLQKSPYLNRVFIFHKGLKGVLNNLFVLSELRRLRLDVAVNLYQHYSLKGAIKMALLFKFIRPQKTIGRNTDGKGFFYDVRIEDTINSQRHDVEYKLDLVKALGCEIKDKRLEVWIDDVDTEKVEGLLERSSVSGSDLLIGISPGGHRPSRRWDWKDFAQVCQDLAKRYQAKIIITGTEDERSLAKKIIAALPNRTIDACGKLSLSQLAALIKRCNLYISNDTAPMHIANALGTPLVAIMGPGPMKTAPYLKDKCIILTKDVDCAPCFKFRCKDMRCLKTIATDEVTKACDVLLKDYAQV